MIPGDPRYDPAARKKKIADLKVETNFKVQLEFLFFFYDVKYEIF